MSSQHFEAKDLNRISTQQVQQFVTTKQEITKHTLPPISNKKIHHSPNKHHQHKAEVSHQTLAHHNHHHHNHDHYMQEHIQRYLNMQTLNPDWKFAQQHGQSTKPGIVNNEKQRSQCICCLRRVNKEPVALCENSKQLEFLGYGFPLYFIFLKYAIIILFLEIINFNIIQLYISIKQNYDFCINHIPKIIPHQGESLEVHCTSFMVLLAEIAEQITAVETTLRITSFMTLLVCLIYVRDNFTKTWMYYDQRETSYADFSVIVENIPTKNQLGKSKLTIGNRLRNFFNDREIFPQKLNIGKINLVGQLQNFEQLQHQKKIIVHQIAAQMKKNNQQKHQNKVHPTNSKTLKSEKKQLKLKLKGLETKINQEKKRLKLLIQKEDVDCNKAIVCFETEDQMLQVEEIGQRLSPQQLRKHFGSQGIQITIQQSPQPREINWENINVSQASHIKRSIISWIIFLAVLGVLTVIVYFLFSYKSHEVSLLGQKMGAIIVVFSLLGIIFFNKFILSYIIHHLVDFQLHKTGESSQFSFMLKYSLGLFFTTALMTILVEGVTHDNVYTQHYGIVQQQTIMFFFNALLVPLIWLINPWYLWKLIQRKLYQHSPYMTQEDANKLMEDPEYLMGKRYGQVLESLWFTYLYSCVIPFGSFLVFIGLILYYWVDKYNLLRKSSILQGVSGNLCMKALFLMQFILVLKPGGQLIFDGLIRHDWSGIAVLQISIGFLYLILPMQNILNYFHPQKFMSSDSNYTQLKQKNFLSYELYHPLTKEEQLKKHFQKIQQSQLQQNQRKIESNVSIERHLKKKHSFVRPHKPKDQVAQNLTDQSFVDERAARIDITYSSF